MISRSEEMLIMEIRPSRLGTALYKILDVFGGLEVEVENPPKEIHDDALYLVRYRSAKHVEIIKFFGNKKDPDTIEAIILFRHGIRMTWPTGFDMIDVKSFGNLASVESSQTTPYLI